MGFGISSVGIPKISPYTKSEQPRIAGKHLTRQAKNGYAVVANIATLRSRASLLFEGRQPLSRSLDSGCLLFFQVRAIFGVFIPVYDIQISYSRYSNFNSFLRSFKIKKNNIKPLTLNDKLTSIIFYFSSTLHLCRSFKLTDIIVS